MRPLIVATAAVLFITSVPAEAWWDNWRNGNNNNRYYNQGSGQYNGQSYGQNSGNASANTNGDINGDVNGNTTGDGSIGFKGDIRFNIKMKNRGNARMDGYYYDNQGNVWQGNNRNRGYYYDRYDPYYSQPYSSQPYYGPRNRYPSQAAPAR